MFYRYVAADVWSVPSFTDLRREGLAVDRWDMLHSNGHRYHHRPGVTLGVQADDVRRRTRCPLIQ